MSVRQFAFLLACFAFVASQQRSVAADGMDAVYDRLLGRYVTQGADGVNRVDYGRWKADIEDRARLARYIAALETRKPSKMRRAEAFAYWANLYNAVTLKVVLDRYPVASIRDIKSDGFFDPKAYIGPWRTKRVTVEGKAHSLDDIEHAVLRPTFGDPRVHYAVSCAAYGCPNLQTKAWAAATLDVDLDTAARQFVNHARGVSVLHGKLKVSSIYKWFNEDFGGSDEGVLAHLREYAGPKLAAALVPGVKIVEDHYDWSLNDSAGRTK